MRIALAVALAAGVLASAPVALADDSAPDLRIGQAGTLVNGDVVQTWTISGLRKSGDVIPAQVAGTLWEATATNTAVAGTVIPIIPAFNARAGGANYRVLFAVPTAQGINPSTLTQGEKSTGKIYFDIDAGTVPDHIVFNDGQADRLVWVNAPEPATAPPAAPQSTNPAGPPRSTPAAPATASPAGTPAATSPSTPAATSQGTPVTPGAATPADTPAATSQGTPATSQDTPAAPGAATPAATPAGTPAATSAGTPATSQDTPAAPTAGAPTGATPPPVPSAPAAAAGTPAASSAGTPATSQGTPAAPTTTTVIPPPPGMTPTAG